mmetsp:Transcript_30255/g.66159  ORF Transcript_30255/g.66159 Transcript_30255/m.66159 type:complete len:744 (-) Transcript_30255:132-2363(-)
MPRFKTGDVEDEETCRCSFADLGLPAPLLQSLREMGCEHPSPVQLKTIPAALSGRDVIVQAKSGTGKTIAFCSVVLKLVITRRSTTQGLVVMPTREIAMQVADEMRRLGWYLFPAVSVACFIGGTPAEEDIERIEEEQPHVVVGTPGRLLKLLREKALRTHLQIFVLDEADRLLGTDFRQDITAITELVFTDSMQFLAVSATFLPPLVTAAENLFIHVEKRRCKGGAPPMREVPQTVFLCTSAVKKDAAGRALLVGIGGESNESAVLRGILHFRWVVQGYHVRQKLPALREILTTTTYRQAFVFCKDGDQAVQIAEMLCQVGISAAASSGRMDQAGRTEAFAGIKRFQYRVLVCTDLLARGVDVENVDVVVNLDLPMEKETYLHRSGRSARFGSIGWSVSVVFEGDENQHLSFFQAQLGFELADYSDRERVFAAHLERLAALDEDVAALAAQFPLAAGGGQQGDEFNMASADVHRQSRISQEQEVDELEQEEAMEEMEEEDQWEENVEEWDEEPDDDGFIDNDIEIEADSGYSSSWKDPTLQPRQQCEQDIYDSTWSRKPSCTVPEAARCTGQCRQEVSDCDMRASGHRSPLLEQAPLRQPPLLSQTCPGQTAQQKVYPAAAAQPENLCASALGASIRGGQQPTPTPWSSGLAQLLPPPPILRPPSWIPSKFPQEALVPEWQPWMLHCAAFSDYAGRFPETHGPPPSRSPMGCHATLSQSSARLRLEELWARHCWIWAGAPSP